VVAETFGLEEGETVMAVADKGASSGPGMGKIELKKALMIAKRQPMHCALAQSADGKAVLVIDKIKKGPALYRNLKSEAPDTKNHRFGMLEIDQENRKLCRFTINKASAGGMARKLVIALKGTGFSKVQILLEDGTPVEMEEGEDEEMDLDLADSENEHDEDEGNENPSVEAEQPPVAASAPPQPEASNEPQPSIDASAPPADGAQQAADPATQGNEPDAASLTKELTALVKQMISVIAANPTMKTALAELATDAQASLKRGDLQQAAAGIEILRQAVSGGADPSAATPNGQSSAAPTSQSTPNGSAEPAPNADDDELGPEASAAAPAVTKARTAWVATRQKVEGDLGKLHAAFGGAFKGHDQEEQISKAFRERVESVLNTLDEELAQVLDSVNRARSRRERAEMVERAHAILARHQKHVTSDPTIAALDTNPFVPLAIARTMSATIDALSRALR
jgi:hypothetical protein